MFCQTLIEIIYAYVDSCYLYFLIGNLTQNIYSGKFSNVNNEFIVTNARN